MQQALHSTNLHHARTGAAGYDVIGFTSPPVANLIFHQQSRVSAIRHYGLSGSGISHSFSHKPDLATLTLDLGAVGTCVAKIGGLRSVKPMRRNQFNFIPADQPVELEFPAEHSCIAAFVPVGLLRDRAVHSNDLAEPIVCEPDERAAALFKLLTREIGSPGFASDLAVDRLLALLMEVLGRQRRTDREHGERFHIAPATLRRVREYIDAHLAQPLTVPELAAVAGLSTYYFCRVFKLATGYSPYHYVAWQRLTRAAHMLSETAMPMDSVAQACGFVNVSHFTTAFSREMGLSPGRYRREHSQVH